MARKHKDMSFFFTSLMAFESASSSEETGIEFDDSEAYRFTMLILSMIEVVFPLSLKMVRSFFLIISGGEPKSGPNGTHNIRIQATTTK